ncbi:MAG: hypothetical protein HRU09_16915 [Oligoflexales bacterium]|nr:hypothetical protein [Oligoflexales bacterium]
MRLQIFLWTFFYCIFLPVSYAQVILSPQGIQIRQGSSWVHLTPTIQFNLETWKQAGECLQFNRTTSRCPLGEVGHIQVKIQSGQIRLSFYAKQDAYVSGIGLQGTAYLPGARAFLSNGLQSWSQSGVIKLPSKKFPATELRKALTALDQKEEHRKGHEFSWDLSFIKGSQHSIFLGALSAKVFRTWIQAYQETNKQQLFHR